MHDFCSAAPSVVCPNPEAHNPKETIVLTHRTPDELLADIRALSRRVALNDRSTTSDWSALSLEAKNEEIEMVQAHVLHSLLSALVEMTECDDTAFGYIFPVVLA